MNICGQNYVLVLAFSNSNDKFCVGTRLPNYEKGDYHVLHCTISFLCIIYCIKINLHVTYFASGELLDSGLTCNFGIICQSHATKVVISYTRYDTSTVIAMSVRKKLKDNSQLCSKWKQTHARQKKN